MNDTTFQGNGSVKYVPVVVDTKPKPITNADRIRSLTDEELATIIAWPYIAPPKWCANHPTCPFISEDPTPCDKCALEWLKEEVTDG